MRLRVFLAGALGGFAVMGLAAPMLRFLINAWSHAGF
jgi:hypothetical protein